VAGGQPAVVVSDAHGPHVSPDGTLIAAHTRVGAGHAFAIFSMHDGSLVRKLPGPAPDTFQWEPTSTALIYSRGPGNVDNLWRLPIDGSPAAQITQFTADRTFAFAIRADGRLALARGEAASDVIVFRY
jgi:hypothetical protein